MTSLEVLDLSFNDLEDLSEENVFLPPANLSRLYLSHNRFSQLPMAKVEAMPNLRLLDLEHNNFASFDYKLMSVISNDTELRFAG